MGVKEFDDEETGRTRRIRRRGRVKEERPPGIMIPTNCIIQIPITKNTYLRQSIPMASRIVGIHRQNIDGCMYAVVF